MFLSYYFAKRKGETKHLTLCMAYHIMVVLNSLCMFICLQQINNFMWSKNGQIIIYC